ncbi:MAG: alpha-amylase family glycosyl hydrolase [bacterium]
MKKLSIPLGTLSLLFMILSCIRVPDLHVAEHSLLPKMAPPVTLQSDSTVIVLADYFRQPQLIDSVVTDPSVKSAFSADSALLILKPATQKIPLLSVLEVWAQGTSYSILLKRSPEVWVNVTFQSKGKEYKKVQLAGQMNDWNPARCNFKQTDGTWEGFLFLFPGNYQYKLVLDGKWVTDPGNSDSASNGIGGYNSVLRAGNLSSPRLPFLYAKESAENHLLIGGIEKATDIFIFWQNYLLPQSFLESDTSGLIVHLPNNAKQVERSFLRVWAGNETGLSNDLLIPLHYGQVVTNHEELSRSDRETLILYFLMIDRFRNGNPENDIPVKDPEVDPRLNYQGGDLKGILEKLDEDYFTNLGVNAIWISPLTQNPLTAFREFPKPHRKYSGYHGYWPITLTTVDSRFGVSDDLKNLVKEAHRKDISVILDFVSHHVHQDYPLLKEHPDWMTPVDLPNGKKNIRIWDEYRLSTWFDIFLPTLDLSKPEVYELVSDSAAYWISEYELDGFRHDATKHVPEIYWRTLTRKLDSILEPENRSFFQIGETFGSRKLIASYINPGMLDAQFDFNLYWEIRNAFALDQTSFRDLHIALLQSLSFFGSHHLMGNITGNQDMARFISYAGGALRMNEDDREAGWKRDIQIKDPIAYRKLASLMAFNMTIPGVPVIYYGDEYGMPGANDPDNRRMMKFDGLTVQEQQMLDITRKLTHLRSQNLSLLYGDFLPLKISDKIYVYLRTYLDQAVLVAFNKHSSSKTVELTLPPQFGKAQFVPQFGSSILIKGRSASLSLPANSFEILTKKSQPIE